MPATLRSASQRPHVLFARIISSATMRSSGAPRRRGLMPTCARSPSPSITKEKSTRPSGSGRPRTSSRRASSVRATRHRKASSAANGASNAPPAIVSSVITSSSWSCRRLAAIRRRSTRVSVDSTAQVSASTRAYSESTGTTRPSLSEKASTQPSGSIVYLSPGAYTVDMRERATTSSG